MPYCLTDIKIEVSFLLKIITICSRKMVPFRTEFHFYHCKQKAPFDVVGVLVSSCVVHADAVGTDGRPPSDGDALPASPGDELQWVSVRVSVHMCSCQRSEGPS